MKKLTLNLDDGFSLCEALKVIRYSVESEVEIHNVKKRKSYFINENEMKNIKGELELILASNKVVEIFEVLQRLNILQDFIPELSSCYKFNQHSKYHNRDVFNHILSVTSIVPFSINIKLAALLHDIAKPLCFSLDKNGQGHFYGHDILSAILAKDILMRFGYDLESINKICILIKNHMKKFKVSCEENIERLISAVEKENIEDLLMLQIADDLSKNPKYINVKPLIEMYKTVKIE